MNLVVAGVAGVAVPIGLHASGRDPAHGASVLLTFITDAMGFFLFLGLASYVPPVNGWARRCFLLVTAALRKHRNRLFYSRQGVTGQEVMWTAGE